MKKRRRISLGESFRLAPGAHSEWDNPYRLEHAWTKTWAYALWWWMVGVPVDVKEHHGQP